MSEEKSFPTAITKYFGFLLDSGFSIYDKAEYDSGAFGNGYYRFSSGTVGIEIALDRGQVLVAIGKISQDRKDWLEWSHVLKAYASGVEAYDFDVDVETQVKRISELLQQFCEELLDGNFSDERLLREIEDAYGKNFLKQYIQQ